MQLFLRKIVLFGPQKPVGRQVKPGKSRQQQQKEEKISAKESTGVRWPPGSEWAAGGKAEGRNGMK